MVKYLNKVNLPSFLSNSFATRIGLGNGAFALKRELLGYAPSDSTVATGDYNGDGARDLFSGGGKDAFNRDVVVAYRGDTLGNIYDSVESDKALAWLDTGYRAFTKADFDGDGKSDVTVISDRGLKLTRKIGTSAATIVNLDSSVSFLTINGIKFLPSSSHLEMISGVQDSSGNYRIGVKARFNVATYSSLILSTTLTGNPIKLRQGDFNGDGNTDVAVLVTGTSGPSINIAMGRGDGTFGAAANYSLLVGVTDFTVGDIDYDSREDVAYSLSGSTTIAFSVLRNRGDGTMERVNSPRANVATELMSPLI